MSKKSPTPRTTAKKTAKKPARRKVASTASQQKVAHSGRTGSRVLQVPKRVWYKPLGWRNRQPVPAYTPLPKGRLLFWRVLKQLYGHWKLFGGIVLTYGLLNLILVRGLSGSSDLSDFKSTLDSLAHGVGGKLASSFASFTYLLTTSGSGNTDTSGIYQSVLLIVCSLAFIWALRQVLAKHTVRIRDSFYQGMYPLIPFLLLFALVGLQLLPMVLGGGLYSAVITNSIAIHWWEKGIFIAIFAFGAFWSLRMITASLFALYVVTLPDMTPLQAYRSAKQLVYGRRLLIWRKLIFLPIILFLVAVAIELPLILFVTPIATWTFFILSMLALPVVHSYLYNLYREML